MSDGNFDLMLHLGFNNAIPKAGRPASYVSLQRRHPDGERWVEVAAFHTKADAEAALAHAVEGGHAEAGELRVHRANLPQP